MVKGMGMNVGRNAMLNEDAPEVAAMRTVVLASADAGLRQRLRASLTGLRWQVREAGGRRGGDGAVGGFAVGGAAGG